MRLRHNVMLPVHTMSEPFVSSIRVANAASSSGSLPAWVNQSSVASMTPSMVMFCVMTSLRTLHGYHSMGTLGSACLGEPPEAPIPIVSCGGRSRRPRRDG